MPLITAGGQASNTYFFYNQQKRFLKNKAGNSDSTTISNYNGTTNTNESANITMNWTLFNGFGMMATYKRLEEMRAIGQENTKVTIENTIAQAQSAYFNVIQQSKKVFTFQNALEISKERLKLAENKYKVGSGAKQDYLSAQVDYNTDSSALIAQNQLVSISKTNLNLILNWPANTLFKTEDTIIVNQNINIDELKNAVTNQNPNLLVAQRNKNVAYLSLKELQAQRFPLIYAFTGLNQNFSKLRASTFPNGASGLGLNYGISATMTIFNGNSLNRQIQNAKISEQNYQYQYESLKQQLLADLENNFLQYKNSIALMALEKNSLTIARQNVVLALQRNKTGIATSLETRDAQRNAVATESRMIDATYNAKIA